MVRYALWFSLLATALLIPAVVPSSAAVGNLVVAAGAATHEWANAGDISLKCGGGNLPNGAFTVVVNLDDGTGSIEGASPCAFPGMTFDAGECSGTPTGIVTCYGGLGDASLFLNPDGVLYYESEWLLPTKVWGTLTRA